MKLSIVATLYRSERHVTQFCARATAAARAFAGTDYEIVLVNDGSLDRSFEFAREAAAADPRLVLIDLSRNFGHHKAMMTGLRHSTGDRVFLIDSDLEEEPEWLAPFAERLARDCCDVVYGVQIQRKGGWIERLTGQWFYFFFHLLTGLAIPKNAVTARLMTRRYVDALVQHQEREIMIAGLWLITGFDQRPLFVSKRNSSETTYTFRRKIAIVVNSVTSFSNAPLIGIFYSGVFISLLAAVYSAYLVFHWVCMARPPSGWTSVMASIWLLGGLIISFMGIIGIYLSKIYSETKQRPNAIVREIFRAVPKALPASSPNSTS